MAKPSSSKTSASKPKDVSDTPPKGPLPKPVTSIEDLAALGSIEEEVAFNYQGRALSVKIRPVFDRTTADSFIDILPPKKPALKKDMPEEYDYEDREYLRKRMEGQRLRSAFLIEKGSDLTLPGESWEAKADWLWNHVPHGVINTLVGRIFEISFVDAEVIERANFTSTNA